MINTPAGSNQADISLGTVAQPLDPLSWLAVGTRRVRVGIGVGGGSGVGVSCPTVAVGVGCGASTRDVLRSTVTESAAEFATTISGRRSALRSTSASDAGDGPT